MATAASGAGDGFEEFCREEFNPAEVFSKPEALKGYRVLSCTQYILGPSCASYLGELGAEVIKIEQPRAGEPMRHTTPWNEPSLYPCRGGCRSGGRGWGSSGPTSTSTSSVSTSTGPRPGRSCSSWRPSPTSWWRTTGPARSTAGASATGSSGRTTSDWSTPGWAASGAGARAARERPTTSSARPRAAPSGSPGCRRSREGTPPSTPSGSPTTGAG